MTRKKQIANSLQPLEDAIANFLLPALVDHKCSPLERVTFWPYQLRKVVLDWKTELMQ
jgi:hypothetical protein